MKPADLPITGIIRPYLRHLRGKGMAIGALFLLGLAGAAISLTSPLIGKTFIDRVAGAGDYALVPYLALAMLGVAVADLVLGTVTRMTHARLSAAVLVEIRERLFSHCLKAPLTELERFRHGDLLSRFGADIPKIQTLLVDGILGFFQNILFLLVAAAIMLRLSASLALWSFLGVAVALAITASFRSPVTKGTSQVRDAMVDLSHFLAERLNALRPVRFHRAEASEQSQFAGLNATLVRRLLRFQLLDAAASGFPMLTLTASLAWIYLLGGRLLEAGAITLGTFVAFILYQGRLLSPAMGLLGLVRNLQEARISLERVSELLVSEKFQAPPEIGNVAGRIALEEVGFSYGGNVPVLDGVSLEVTPGERVALFGVSGAGKSTLVQVLFGLRSPHRGRVTVGVSTPERLGYAGHDPFLLHGTVEENIRYGTLDAPTAALVEAARLAEAHGFIEELPAGYATVIGGRGLALSDGQRQRIGLARLILSDPEILILDEAFSALDPETEARVRRNLHRRFPGRTMLFISHRLHGLETYDRLLLLQDGVIRPVHEEELRSILAGGLEGNKEKALVVRLQDVAARRPVARFGQRA